MINDMKSKSSSSIYIMDLCTQLSKQNTSSKSGAVYIYMTYAISFCMSLIIAQTEYKNLYTVSIYISTISLFRNIK